MNQLQIDSCPNIYRSSTLVWWLGMLTLCIVPFMSSWRVGTLSSFYLEAGTLFFTLCLFGLTMLTRTTRCSLPATSIGLLLLAALLMLQARVMHLPYASQSDLTALVFAVLAMLAWAVRDWVVRIGQTPAVTILALALVLGVLLQSMVCVMQFTGVTGWIPGVLRGPGNHYIYGQLAQRNHLGHYLMWGVLALCFLWQQRRLPNWLIWPLLIWFTGVMGLIGSRTIIVYVLVIGLSLFFWRWRAGAAANRLLLMLATAIGLVLLFQLILSPLFEMLLHINFQSGTARLEQGGFSQSGRQMEWHKAWLIFKSAPWFGYGWGSYAYQGFAIADVYPNGFRQYENTVLFTHCHNLVLQLLAETGIIGFLIASICFIWAIWPHFYKGFNPASIVLVSMILVSLCHSMLEYPLWYSYFLAVFVLFIALTPLPQKQQAEAGQPAASTWVNQFWAVMTLLCMILILWQMLAYQRFLKVRADRNLPQAEQINHIRDLRKHMYFMRYYIDMAVIEKLNVTESFLPLWGKQAALLSGRYRPYSNTFIRGLYLEQEHQSVAAKLWFSQVSHYYPGLVPNFISRIKQQPQAVAVIPQLQQDCLKYQQQSAQKMKCL
jgi:O-antigen ligase